MDPKLHKNIEKSPLRSKKLIAAMTWNIGWLMLIGYGIYNSIDSNVLISMVVTAGSTQMTYLGGQAAVDAYVRRMVAGFGKYKPQPAPAPKQTSPPSMSPSDHPQIKLTSQT
jgi:hypothetical protein